MEGAPRVPGSQWQEVIIRTRPLENDFLPGLARVRQRARLSRSIADTMGRSWQSPAGGWSRELGVATPLPSAAGAAMPRAAALRGRWSLKSTRREMP